MTIAVAAEGVLACLLPSDSGLVVAAEQYRMKIRLGMFKCSSSARYRREATLE
jgi:hypothetical protein